MKSRPEELCISVPQHKPDSRSRAELSTRGLLFSANSRDVAQVVLRTGVPVKWNSNDLDQPPCVYGIVAFKRGLNIPPKNGARVIEITPEKEGIITGPSDMSMTTGSVVVHDEATL